MMAKPTIKKKFFYSLGMFVLLGQLWIFINAEAVFLENFPRWFRVTLIYLVFQVSGLAIPSIRSYLYRVSLIKALPRLLLFHVAGFAVVTVLYSIIGGRPFTPEYILGVNPLVLLFHGLFTATIEEPFFHDFLEKRMGRFMANVAFAFFHYSVSFGNVFIMLIRFFIGYGFSLVKANFAFDEHDNIPNIGVHWGWNSGVEGLLRGGV